MTQKLILAPLLHEEPPFNCVVCSELKSNGGAGKAKPQLCWCSWGSSVAFVILCLYRIL